MFNWDSAARKYVEHDDLPMTTFGPLKDYVLEGANDNAPVAAQLARERPRKGDWMQLYSGKQFWPMDPRADDVEIEDIAHALSMQCRYAGHCVRFYSVAEHSVHLARYVSPENALWALLHDASEAYLVDVPRPVKPYLAGYKAAEWWVMQAVCKRFGLPPNMPQEVHDADNRIIADERVNMRPCVAEWSGGYDRPLGIRLEYWEPARAEQEFLSEFERLQNMRVVA